MPAQYVVAPLLWMVQRFWGVSVCLSLVSWPPSNVVRGTHPSAVPVRSYVPLQGSGPNAPYNAHQSVARLLTLPPMEMLCYELHGNSSSECLHTATWSSPAPQCKSVTCGLPVIPKYAKIIYDKVVTSNSTEFGLGITYKCLPPLALFGNERGYCTPNRTWTDPPECREVSCQVPAAVENGFMTSAVRREYLFMDRVRYGCYKGYVLDGPMEIVCEKSGHWSNEPICKEEAK
ncbi:beta-2-glycoprotein 1-like isoform X2 [Xyrauchen texanus]|uniref:beta-2-glycoprotein 1-like isoform X2 n=1 Tax=Xyrauchen texanus TaxID=154827 RepID=UPI002241E9F1|nr:beta-2-glycoprotein 1-like isoform X2 [Xyrauchen texanus]